MAIPQAENWKIEIDLKVIVQRETASGFMTFYNLQPVSDF